MYVLLVTAIPLVLIAIRIGLQTAEPGLEWRANARRMVRLLWIARVPILAGLLILLLPWLSQGSPLQDQIANVYVTESAVEATVLLLLSYMAAQAAVVTGWTAISFAKERFGVKGTKLPETIELRAFEPSLWLSDRGSWRLEHVKFVDLPVVVLTLPTLVVLMIRSSGHALVALVCTILIVLVLRFVIDRCSKWIASNTRPLWAWVRDLREIALNFLESLGPGYVHRPSGSGSEPTRRYLYPGHTRALIIMVAWFIIYSLLGFASMPSFAPDGCLPDAWGGACMPPIGYLILLFTFLTWLISAAAFLIDYLRWSPTLVVAVALSLIYVSCDVDHQFAIYQSEASGSLEERLQPSAVYRTWLDNLGREDLPVVAVTTSGGGITAATWTAKVLQGLSEQTGGRFNDAVVVISGASGGAIGATQYLQTFGRSTVLDTDCVSDAPRSLRGDATTVDIVAKDTLRPAIWGLVYPDFIRLGAPVLVDSRDRGLAAERAWAALAEEAMEPIAASGEGKTTPVEAPRYSVIRYGERVACGQAPMALINTMTVQDGYPVALGPARFLPPTASSEECWQASGSASSSRVCGFLDLFPERSKSGTDTVSAEPAYLDMDMLTAARMSGTFPYIAPIAWPDAGDLELSEAERETTERLYLADGGYFDNYGVVALVEWLSRALAEQGSVAPGVTNGATTVSPRDLLVIRISHLDCANPNTSGCEDAVVGSSDIASCEAENFDSLDFGDGTDADGLAATTLQNAVIGPFKALLSARGPTQTLRNDQALRSFANALDANRGSVGWSYKSVEFTLDSTELPLSWKLSECERERIENAWPIAWAKNEAAISKFLQPPSTD